MPPLKVSFIASCLHAASRFDSDDSTTAGCVIIRVRLDLQSPQLGPVARVFVHLSGAGPLFTTFCEDYEDRYIAATSTYEEAIFIDVQDSESTLNRILSGDLFVKLNQAGRLKLGRFGGKTILIQDMLASAATHTFKDSSIILNSWERYKFLTCRSEEEKEIFWRLLLLNQKIGKVRKLHFQDIL